MLKIQVYMKLPCLAIQGNYKSVHIDTDLTKDMNKTAQVDSYLRTDTLSLRTIVHIILPPQHCSYKLKMNDITPNRW